VRTNSTENFCDMGFDCKHITNLDRPLKIKFL